MVRRFAVLAALSLVTGAGGCTALLGDFEVTAGTVGADGGGVADATPPTPTPVDGGGTPDGSVGPLPPDAGDGPPPPSGAFVSLLTFASTNTSPPANMRVAYGVDGSLFVLFAYSIPTTIGSTTLNTVGNFDVGLVKVLPNGQIAWVRSYGSAASESAGGLAVDASGNVYISGTTEGMSIDFGLASGPLNRKSSRYLPWIAKVAGSDGKPLAAISIDTAGGHQGGACQSLAVRQNRVAALCNLYGPASFPTTQTNLVVTPFDGPTTPTLSFVVAMLDDQLRALWANGMGSDAQDVGASVALAPNGDVVFTANVNGVSAASTSKLQDTKATVGLTLTAPSSAVIGRLAAATGNAVWARPLSNDPSNGLSVNGAAVDVTPGGGRVVAVGGLTGKASLGNQKVLETKGQSDVFLATFAFADGQTLDGLSYGGALSEEARAVAVDRWSSPVVVGSYRSSGLSIAGKNLPDPLSNAQSGFIYRSAPNLDPFWAGGFTTGLANTFLQAWSVASDPLTGAVAAAGVFQGVINFGDGNPVRSASDGAAYSVWVVQRRP